MQGRKQPLFERLWYSEAGSRPIRAALAPFSTIYAGTLAMRARVWRQFARHAPVTTVSVGNLTVGGNGKTPFTLFLASRLMERGFRAGIVSRGYGRSSGTRAALVSDGSRILMTPRQAGDEPIMMARSFAGPIAVARRRIEAIALIAQRAPVDVVILDDGFQHLRLKRDLDLLLINESRGFGNGRILPAGPMREPLGAACRADAIVLISPDGEAGAFTAAHRGAIKRRPVVRAALKPSALVHSVRGEWVETALELRRRRVCLVSGLARPTGFHSMVRGLGAEIVRTLDYPDHHDYGPGDWENMIAAARDAELVLTTEKDLVKLERFSAAGFSLYALRLKVVMGEAEEVRLLEMAVQCISSHKCAKCAATAG